MVNQTIAPGNGSYKEVLEAVEDHIMETRLFPGIAEIVKRTSISPKRVRQILGTLVGQEQLSVVYHAASRPTVYAPRAMVRQIQLAEHKPKWLSSYSFPEKARLEQEMSKVRDALMRYDLLEGLLHRTDIPLEDSVECALSVVEFDNVKRYPDPDNPDVTFDYNHKRFICEVKGKTKDADKDDVLELEGWMKAELENSGDPDDLTGLLFVNHYRHLTPTERPEPLTKHAKVFAKRYGFRVLTTLRLFETIQQVLNASMSKQDARSTIAQGETYG